MEALTSSLSSARERITYYRDRLRRCEDITFYHKKIIYSFPLHVILGQDSISAFCDSYTTDEEKLRDKEREYEEKYAKSGEGEEAYDPFSEEKEAGDNAQENDSCSICLRPICDDDIVFGCLSEISHKFHPTCLYKWWMTKKNSCPECRGKFIDAGEKKLSKWKRKLKIQAGMEITKTMSRLVHNPTFGCKYMIGGRPVRRRAAKAINLLKTVRKKVTSKFE